MSRRVETSVAVDEPQRRAVLKGVFVNYYHTIHPNKVVFDTNRAWPAKMPALVRLFPDCRIICCVRDLAWIMDSVERLVRRNAFDLSGMFGYETNGTVFTRINRISGSDGMVGYALDALREAYFGEEGHRLILLEYEALARAPRATLQQLYAILNERWFEHDFDNVDYDAEDFDLAIGARGLHSVRRRVEWRERASILPPDLFERFAGDMFWRVHSGARATVPVIGRPA